MALWAFVVLSGCGTAEPSSPEISPDTSTPAGGELTPERRIATIQDAINHVSKLTGTDADSRRQQLLNWLKARPEFEDAAAEEDGSLWARFTDGRLFLIIANRDPITQAEVDSIVGDLNLSGEEDAAASPVPGAPNELPKSLTARFYLGGEPQTYPTVIRWLKGLVKQRNYTLASGAGVGEVDDLKNVQGDGIFYWTSHGGSGRRRDGSIAYGIATATQISLLNDIKYKQDWDSLRLVYTTHITRNILPSIGAGSGYYAVTAEFVQKYMSFAKDSFIYLGACTALNPRTIALAQAFAKKGGVVAGWTSTFTTTKDYQTALYVFDRLLGLNAWRPETPDQRPFDYKSIKANMAPYDKETIPVVQGLTLISEFLFMPGSNGTSGLLAPSIQYMYMDEETNALILTGKFGSEQGRAEVGGVPRPIRSWAEEKVEIDMPLRGAGSSGEVVVYSKDRKSNVRPLTDWRGEFIWSFVPGPGSLKFEGPIKVHFRADVHTFREEHGQQPKDRVATFRCARDTDGHVTASGSYSEPGGSTTTWDGTATLSNRIATPVGPNLVDCLGEIDTQTKQLRLFLFVSAQQGMTITQGSKTVPFPAVWAHGDGPLLGSNPLPSLYIPLTQSWDITDGFRKTGQMEPTQRLDWGVITPTKIPADSMAR